MSENKKQSIENKVRQLLYEDKKSTEYSFLTAERTEIKHVREVLSALTECGAEVLEAEIKKRKNSTIVKYCIDGKIPLGMLCPSPVSDLLFRHRSRGRMLKNPPDYSDYYAYFYDGGRLTAVEEPGGRINDLVFEYNGETVVLRLEKGTPRGAVICRFDDLNRITEYLHIVIVAGIYECEVERYKYVENRISEVYCSEISSDFSCKKSIKVFYDGDFYSHFVIDSGGAPYEQKACKKRSFNKNLNTFII